MTWHSVSAGPWVEAKPDPRFNPKEPLLTRLIDLADTGMAVPRGEEMQRLITELAALGPIPESQLTNYIKNRKSRQARLAKETAAAGGVAGAAARAGAVLGAGAAMAARASSPASTSRGAAAYPSAPSAFSDYVDDKGFRLDGFGRLYKVVLRTDGVSERQLFSDEHAGNRR